MAFEPTDEQYREIVRRILNKPERITKNLTVRSTHTALIVDATAGAVTLTLPLAKNNVSRVYVVKKIDAVNNVVIAATSPDTIDGAASITLTTQYQSATILSDGIVWWII